MPQLEHLNNLHEMCKAALADLRSSIDEFVCSSESTRKLLELHWGDVMGNNAVAMIAYDSFLTCLTNISDLTRKFRINLELNNLEKSSDRTLLKALQATGTKTTTTNQTDLDTASCSGSLKSTHSYHKHQQLLPAEENNEDDDSAAAIDENASASSRLFSHHNKDLSAYTTGRRLKAYVTFVQDRDELRFFALDTDCPHIAKILKLCNMLHLRQYTGLPPDGDVFGVVRDNLIWRAERVRSSPPDTTSGQRTRKYPALMLEFGDIIQIGANDVLYRLSDAYQRIPALALKCQLQGVVGGDGESSEQEMRQLLEGSAMARHDFVVQQRNGNVLLLQLQLPPDNDAVEGAARPSDAPEPSDSADETSESNATSDDDDDDDYDEEYDDCDEPSPNPMKLLMGYVPHDDRRLCRFYDPQINGCFKGANCRQEHTPAQPEGWTKDKLPAATVLDNHQPVTVYAEGSVLSVTVTYVNSLNGFYAHVNDPCRPVEPNIWVNEDIPHCNLLRRPPLLYDMVLAKYTDGIWYRAKVLEQAPDSPKKFKVQFVDYGNTQTVGIRYMARCDYEVVKRPIQAVQFRIANIFDTTTEPEVRRTGLSVLSELILNRTFDVRVVSHHEDLIVEFLSKKHKRVPATLLTLGFVSGPTSSS